MNDGENNNHERRLTRLEEFVEVLTNEHIQFAEEHKRLLTAQVMLTDRMDKLTDRMDKLAEAQADLVKSFRESKHEMDERIGVLVRMMDEWIRRHP